MGDAPAIVSAAAEEVGLRTRALALSLVVMVGVSAAAHPQDLEYLLRMPLEQLLRLEISVPPAQWSAHGILSSNGPKAPLATGGGRDAM